MRWGEEDAQSNVNKIEVTNWAHKHVKEKLLKKLSSFCGEGTPYNQASTSCFFLLMKERGLLSQEHLACLPFDDGEGTPTLLPFDRGEGTPSQSFWCGEDTPLKNPFVVERILL